MVNVEEIKKYFGYKGIQLNICKYGTGYVITFPKINNVDKNNVDKYVKYVKELNRWFGKVSYMKNVFYCDEGELKNKAEFPDIGIMEFFM